MWGNHCTRVQAFLPLLASGELRGVDRRRAERHLLICASLPATFVRSPQRPQRAAFRSQRASAAA